MTYSEKLKDPRWQKKRLEILERDGWKCLCCTCEENTLHVHHITYNTEFPWDADNEDLITLCKECHSLWHRILKLDEFIPHVANVAVLMAKQYMLLEERSYKKSFQSTDIKYKLTGKRRGGE